MLNMLSSATRVSLLIMILILCGVNVFALVYYPETIFNTTFLVFKDIILMICAFFFGKSTGGENMGIKQPETEKSTIDPASV